MKLSSAFVRFLTRRASGGLTATFGRTRPPRQMHLRRPLVTRKATDSVLQRALPIGLACLATLTPVCAWGHAVIVSAHPAVGATLALGDVEIRLEFNSRIDRLRSRVIVHRPDGSESLVALAPDAPANILAGSTEATIVGKWKLDWQVLSVDGHITRGEVVFSVREKAPAP